MAVNFDYTGKTVLVTGSTKGIGYAMASDYVGAGANVLISGRKKEAVNKVIEELASKYKIDLKATPKRLIAAVGDCGTKEGCDAVIEVIKKECVNGTVDVLVNNIGIFEPKPFDQIPDDDWINFFNVNVMSGVRLSRYCLSKMLEPVSNDSVSSNENDEKNENGNINPNANGAQNIDLSDKTLKRRGGNIVFISSESGIRIPPHMIHYGMTKAAQIAVARGMAQMCKGVPNVRVNSLLPGPTFTEGVEDYLKSFPENKALGDKFDLEVAKKNYMEKTEPYSLKGSFLNVQEISDACLYLTSDAASGTSGASFRVEGGLIYHL